MELLYSSCHETQMSHMAEYLINGKHGVIAPYLAAMPREYPSTHPRPSPPPEPEPEATSASSIPIPNFSLLLEKLIWDPDRDNEELPPERLQCTACHIPIIVPTNNSDHSESPVLWRLAHCHHSLHLDCLAPLGCPYAISKATQRPYYIHNPGFICPPSYAITVRLTFKTSAATRIRRQKRHNPQFDHCPISRFEDAERMRTWPCPQEGCGQVQFSVLSHGDWYSNVHGMTIDGHSISGPTHL